MKQISLILLIAVFPLLSLAQKTTHESSVKVNGNSKSVFLIYKIKVNKEGKKELQIRFKNKTGVPINVDTELGIYDNGVLEERSSIADCLKKGFFANLFRPIHIVNTDVLSRKNITIELIELKTKQTDECAETHS